MRPHGLCSCLGLGRVVTTHILNILVLLYKGVVETSLEGTYHSRDFLRGGLEPTGTKM